MNEKLVNTVRAGLVAAGIVGGGAGCRTVAPTRTAEDYRFQLTQPYEQTEQDTKYGLGDFFTKQREETNKNLADALMRLLDITAIVEDKPVEKILNEMDRNHDGVITKKEERRYFDKKYGGKNRDNKYQDERFPLLKTPKDSMYKTKPHNPGRR